MTFTIGPSYAGTHLISGWMIVTHENNTGMFGAINARFVNLHSTFLGMWHTDKGGLDGTLHIELSEMHLNNKWTRYAHSKNQRPPCYLSQMNTSGHRQSGVRR